MRYIKPELNKTEFNCPYCGVCSYQIWGRILENESTRGSGWHDMPNWKGALCDHCKQISLWREEKLIYPDKPNMPPPNEDLEEDIKQDYNEAASIVEKSPRAAAALLRLAIQKLCKQLGEKGEELDDDITNLVKKGLPVQIQQSLDIVRVIGNESVHPGEINLNDNKDITYKLFELVNLIAQDRITQPKEVSRLYNSLPQNKIDRIANRDKK